MKSPQIATRAPLRTVTCCRGNAARGLIALVVALVCALGVLRAMPAAAATEGPTVQGYDYGPARLTAHYDTSRSGAPWIVEVHGGYWQTGTADSDYALAERLRVHGYQVFTIDYRKAPAASWPAQREDATAALAWIRARAATFKIDPARVVLIGGSAGGHIAVNTAANLPAGQKVVGTVGLAAVNDPWAAWLAGRTADFSGYGNKATQLADAASLLIGCARVASKDCDTKWIDAWATGRFDASDGPLADWQCDNDPTVPIGQGQRLAQRAVSNGAQAALWTVDCDTHDVLSVDGVEADMTSWVDGLLQPTLSAPSWRARR